MKDETIEMTATGDTTDQRADGNATGKRETTPRGREALVLLTMMTILGFFFWPVVRDSFALMDTGNVTGLMSQLEERYPDPGDRVKAMIWEGAGKGHYKVLQDVLYVGCWEWMGVDGWTRPMQGYIMLCHLLSALLLHVFLRRLGCSATTGYFAALAFALHPALDESLTCISLGTQPPPTFYALAACCLVWPVTKFSWWRHPLAGVFVFLAAAANPNFLMAGPILVGSVVLLGALRPFRWKMILAMGAILVVAVGALAWLRIEATGTIKTEQKGYTDRGLPEDFQEAKERFGHCRDSIIQSCVLLWPGRTTQDGDLTLWDEPLPQTIVRPDVADRKTVAHMVLAVFLTFLGTLLAGPRSSWSASLRAVAFAVAGGVAVVAPYYLLVENINRNRYIHPLQAFIIVGGVVGLERLACLVTRNRATRIALTALLIAPVIIVFTLIMRANIDSVTEGARTSRKMIEQLVEECIENEEIERAYVLGFPRRFGRAGHGWVHPGHWRSLTSSYLHARGRKKLQGGDYYLTQEIEEGKIEFPLDPSRAVFHWQDGTLERLPPDADLSATGPLGEHLHEEVMEHWWLTGRRPTLFETRSAVEALRRVRTLAARNPRVIGILGMAVDRMYGLRASTPEEPDRYLGLASHEAQAEALRQLDAFGILREDTLRRAAAVAGSPQFTATVLDIAGRRSKALRDRCAEIAQEAQTGLRFGILNGYDIKLSVPGDQDFRVGQPITIVAHVPSIALLTPSPGWFHWRWREVGKSPDGPFEARSFPVDPAAGMNRRFPFVVRLPDAPGTYRLYAIAFGDERQGFILDELVFEVAR